MSTRDRFSFRRKGTFFKPVHFDLELADLLIEPQPELFFGPVFPGRRSGKQGRHFLGRLLLPADDLIGMDSIQRRQFVQGLLPLDRFNGHFGLEIRGVTNTLISHYSSLIDTV